MSDAPPPPPDATALMLTLVREGGVRIDTLDAEGATALRTLVQADGSIIVFVREDCLGTAATIDRHFHELERQIGALLGMARKVERRFRMLSSTVRVLYGGSGAASLVTTIASIVAGEVHLVWLALSLLPFGLGFCLRRAPSAWIARRAIPQTEHALPQGARSP